MKQREKEENRGQQLQSSFSLLEYFPKSIFYMLYTISKLSGSQESNASNRVRFGAEIRKIWHSEDNCSKLVRNSHNTRTTHSGCSKLVRNSHNTRTTPSKFAQPMRGANFPLFLHARTTDFPDIFSLIFSRVNSFCNLVFSRHKAFSCNFAIYRGAQRLQKIGDWGDRSSIH